jgi:release factor glutamine methyltransferase
VIALDISTEALAIAQENAAKNNVTDRIAFRHGDGFAILKAGERFDLIVSNPPYVATADIVGGLTFEPRVALDGGADGLAAYRVLFAEAPKHLHVRGTLLVEHGAEQRPALVELATQHGWRVAVARDDLAGRPRVLELERSTAP